MKTQITAATLEDAYKEASKALDCSILELDIEVVQYPSKGFLGMFSKEAIITAEHKNKKHKKTQSKITTEHEQSGTDIEKEIRQKLTHLLQNSCFGAHVSEVKAAPEGAHVYIKLDGEDAALMIGKEGYRYKAFSYMIYNWIKIKYNLASTLEIASFLKTQQESIENYLDTLEEKIAQNGKVQTKPLDGILVKLALEGLRRRYPDKYVAIRTLKNGKKIVIVNEYRRNDNH